MLALIHEALSGGSLGMRLYLAGYTGVCLSRRMRALIAGSKWHRAWLCGYMGLYEQAGLPYGVSDREGYRCRNGGLAEMGLMRLVRVLFHPYRTAPWVPADGRH